MFLFSVHRNWEFVFGFILYLVNAFLHGFGGHETRFLHRFPVITRSPGGTVDVNVIVVEGQRFRFDSIRDDAVQHANPADATVESDSHAAHVVIGLHGHFPGAPSPVVRVLGVVVARRRIASVAVNVQASFRVLSIGQGGNVKCRWKTTH